MQRVRQLWRESGHPMPTVLLGYYAGKYYATTSDNGTICWFASKSRGKIYVAVKAKCEVIMSNGEGVYLIREPGALQVVSCQTPFREVDKWVVGTLFKDPEVSEGVFKGL